MTRIFSIVLYKMMDHSCMRLQGSVSWHSLESSQEFPRRQQDVLIADAMTAFIKGLDAYRMTNRGVCTARCKRDLKKVKPKCVILSLMFTCGRFVADIFATVSCICMVKLNQDVETSDVRDTKYQQQICHLRTWLQALPSTGIFTRFPPGKQVGNDCNMAQPTTPVNSNQLT